MLLRYDCVNFRLYCFFVFVIKGEYCRKHTREMPPYRTFPNHISLKISCKLFIECLIFHGNNLNFVCGGVRKSYGPNSFYKFFQNSPSLTPKLIHSAWCKKPATSSQRRLNGWRTSQNRFSFVIQRRHYLIRNTANCLKHLNVLNFYEAADLIDQSKSIRAQSIHDRSMNKLTY